MRRGIRRDGSASKLFAVMLIITVITSAFIRCGKKNKKDKNVLLSHEPIQNTFYYPHDVLQRHADYFKLFDEKAILHGMVLDCEPVYFEWGGRRWLIEFWKGQYGVATGAEIGAYFCNDSEQGCEFHPAEDYLLDMKMDLVCDNDKIFTMQSPTWWLSGFAAGKFAQPNQLKLKATICFPVPSMAKEFVAELHKMGYSDEEVHTNGRVVTVTYSKPKSQQPYTRTPLSEGLMQFKNRILALGCRLVVKPWRYR